MATENQMRSLILRLGVPLGFPLPPDCLTIEQCASALDPLVNMNVIDWDGHAFVLTAVGTGMYQRLATGQPVPELGCHPGRHDLQE